MLKHRYSFEDGTMSDSVGGSDWTGMLYNDAEIINGSIVLPQTSSYLDFRSGAHARLPSGVLGNSSTISLEMFVDIDRNNKDWCKVLQFGDPIANCPSIQCFRHKDTGKLCCARCNTYDSLCTDQVFNNTKLHFIYAINPSGINYLYVNGEAVISKRQTISIMGRRPQDIILLGAAPVLSDYTLWGSIHEFRIWSGVFRESDARLSYQIGPDFVYNRKYLQMIVALICC